MKKHHATATNIRPNATFGKLPEAVQEILSSVPISVAIGLAQLPGYYGRCDAVAYDFGVDEDRLRKTWADLREAIGEDEAARDRVLDWLKNTTEQYEARWEAATCPD